MSKVSTPRDWAFLQEYAIYEYIRSRFAERTLTLVQVVKGGRVLPTSRRTKVANLEPIVGTTFPDIKKIQLGKEASRPAEVKFLTSMFSYHKSPQHRDAYQHFKKSNGFILCVRHDELPGGLDIDVYELDRSDFIAFCRENFGRLLNRQLRLHAETKIRIMYQGLPSNFNQGTASIRPARESGLWCPTDNKTSFDLARGDRVLFVRTAGMRQSDVNKYFPNDPLCEKWVLDELCITTVTSSVQTRRDYCSRKGISYEQPLWRSDPPDSNDPTRWKWDRVFEFKVDKTLLLSIPVRTLQLDPRTFTFARAVYRAFTQAWSAEIQHEDYRNILEFLMPEDQSRNSIAAGRA